MPTKCAAGAPTVVVPGNHDGVHIGHQQLLARARALAEPNGWCTEAMFFDPHPATVLAPERAPAMLTLPGRRAELLSAMGADRAEAQRFDLSFSQLSPEAFALDVLRGAHNARAVVVGPDFRFGKGRAGSVDTLRALGFEVATAEPVLLDGVRVSSSEIRRRLRAGDVRGAAQMLGRVHETEGVVEHGQALGRTLGFPTANVRSDGTLLPSDGIYAVIARAVDDVGPKLWHGVASLGERPTVDAGRALEVHLFDVSPDLYGKRLRVGWVDRIRDEAKFGGLDELKNAIAHDAKVGRGQLAALPKEWTRWI
ncbi:MAG: riboflavin biosynthesis protein RibF [Polyangiales bacterium]